MAPQVMATAIKNLTKFNPETHTFFRYYWYDFLPVYAGSRSAVLSKVLPTGNFATVIWLIYRTIAFVAVFVLSVYFYDTSFAEERDFSRNMEVILGDESTKLERELALKRIRAGSK